MKSKALFQLFANDANDPKFLRIEFDEASSPVHSLINDIFKQANLSIEKYEIDYVKVNQNEKFNKIDCNYFVQNLDKLQIYVKEKKLLQQQKTTVILEQQNQEKASLSIDTSEVKSIQDLIEAVSRTPEFVKLGLQIKTILTFDEDFDAYYEISNETEFESKNIYKLQLGEIIFSRSTPATIVPKHEELPNDHSVPVSCGFQNTPSELNIPQGNEMNREALEYFAPPGKLYDAHTDEFCGPFDQVIFTNFDPQEKERLQEQVRAIQGTNLNQTIEMPTADLVICNKFQRSEKLMAALAAGKYIVPSAYIIESNRKGYWLPREDFEYGNPKSARRRISFSNVNDSAVARQIHNACFRLRHKAESVRHGAFYGWKAIVFAQGEVGESLIRIIECGGGEAKLFTNVAHKEYKNFTMAIISSKSNPGSFTNVESSILNQNKIPYYTDQVLSTYLLSTDTENALKKSWHLQYRDFMKQQSKK
uniref:BRCT domain-containing protein n=1 Tax=Panagrolaimus davidi TaxID=227884 RepID=A0A914QJJ7_9BILA